MRLRIFIAVAVLLALPVASWAASCTAQAELLPQDRDALVAVGGRLSEAVARGDYSTLLTALLPAEKPAWAGIRDAVEQAGPLMKGGQAQLRNVYLLDATNLATPADTQFFCSNKDGSLTVTIGMHALPPGRYALVLADAAGAALGGQWGMMLAWDGGGSGVESGWKLAGLTVRQGTFDGHDGVWYWTRPVTWPRQTSRGARGTATTRHGICRCRSILSPRRIWKSWRTNRRRSRIRRRMHFLIRCMMAIACGRSMPCGWTPHCASRIWALRMNRRE